MAETSFTAVFDSFLSKVTDDMYMELTVEETNAILGDLLKNAVPWFEFPRVSLELDVDAEAFTVTLTNEEINILGVYMVVEWMGQQLASVENIRLKYSGSDFKFTSQANHMGKLKEIRGAYILEGKHLQRLYKRREVGEDGRMMSTFGQIMEAF